MATRHEGDLSEVIQAYRALLGFVVVLTILFLTAFALGIAGLALPDGKLHPDWLDYPGENVQAPPPCNRRVELTQLLADASEQLLMRIN